MASSEEVVEIILERGNKGLGFNIKGGVDAPHLDEDTGIFITKIRDTGAAAENDTLKEGDKIVEINGQSLVDVKHAQAVNFFRNSGNSVRLKVIQGMEKSILSQRVTASSHNNPDSHSNGPSNYYLYLGVGLGLLTISAIIGYRFVIRKA